MAGEIKYWFEGFVFRGRPPWSDQPSDYHVTLARYVEDGQGGRERLSDLTLTPAQAAAADYSLAAIIEGLNGQALIERGEAIKAAADAREAAEAAIAEAAEAAKAEIGKKTGEITALTIQRDALADTIKVNDERLARVVEQSTATITDLNNRLASTVADAQVTAGMVADLTNENTFISTKLAQMIARFGDPDAPVAVPNIISDHQFFKALAKRGEIEEAEALSAVMNGRLPGRIEEAVAALPGDAQFDARMLLSGATEFDRSNPLVDQLGLLLNWDSAQLDDLWSFAATL